MASFLCSLISRTNGRKSQRPHTGTVHDLAAPSTLTLSYTLQPHWLSCCSQPHRRQPKAFALPISSTRIVFSQLCPLIHIRSLLKCHRSVSLSLTILSNTLYPLFCILNALYTLDILYVWLISFIVCLPSNGRQAPQGQGFLSVLTSAKSLERRTMPDT